MLSIPRTGCKKRKILVQQKLYLEFYGCFYEHKVMSKYMSSVSATIINVEDIEVIICDELHHYSIAQVQSHHSGQCRNLDHHVQVVLR
jgi:hypothetical protein